MTDDALDLLAPFDSMIEAVQDAADVWIGSEAGTVPNQEATDEYLRMLSLAVDAAVAVVARLGADLAERTAERDAVVHGFRDAVAQRDTAEREAELLRGEIALLVNSDPLQ